MPLSFEQYRQEVVADIETCLHQQACQPILFIGSGLSRRYFQGPGWYELLEAMAKNCPEVKREFPYYRQMHKSPIDIGEEFATYYHAWAWGDGRKKFPKHLFDDGDSQIYIKHAVCEYFAKITPDDIDDPRLDAHRAELEAIKHIRPHAIITTNYDTFLDRLFAEYTPVVGQQVLRASYASVGELFKTHGCITAPNSIVLTRRDYSEFQKKKQYLAAKLLTYFVEHPLVFIGYGAEDPNVLAILEDIDEIIAGQGQLVPNIYFIEWKLGCDGQSAFQRERVLVPESGKQVES